MNIRKTALKDSHLTLEFRGCSVVDGDTICILGLIEGRQNIDQLSNIFVNQHPISEWELRLLGAERFREKRKCFFQRFANIRSFFKVFPEFGFRCFKFPF